MKLRNILILPCVALGLAACNPNDPVRIVNTTSYPNLPDIVLPPNADLEAVMFSVPGDLSQQLVKNTDACQAIPAAQRDRKFWIRCGDYRDINGNSIYVTLDRSAFEALRRNLSKLRVRDEQYAARIGEVNRQRAEWRNLNNQAVGLPPTTDNVLRVPVVPGS